MFGSANLSNPLSAGQGKQTGGFGSGSSGGFSFGGTGGASTTTGGFGFGTGTTGGLGGGTTGGFGNTANTNVQGGFANNNMQMNPSGVLPGAAMQSQADYRMQYFDLGLMKYQEIKNASGKHDHLKRFFFEEVNKFQYVVEQQDTLCRDINRTYIKAHRSLLTKLDQEVYRMEQDVNEVKNMLGKHRKQMQDMNLMMRKIQKESRTVGIAVGKLKQNANPPPIVFFDEHIANLENEMDKIERKTGELALALRPEITNAVAMRDRRYAIMEKAKMIAQTGNIVGSRGQTNGSW